MNGKKILFVSSELVPYLPENEVSLMSYETPRMVNSKGGQIRIFMPKYGNINERRHQLHEVIRLSERIQVYFIDNDEYFKRKSTFSDENGNLFPDNDQRAIFFAKGVVETVKKLKLMKPLFGDSKIVTSVYGQSFDGELDKDMVKKIGFDGVSEDSITHLSAPNYNNLLKVAVDYSDAVILASEEIPEELQNHISNLEKPVLPYVSLQEFEDAYPENETIDSVVVHIPYFTDILDSDADGVPDALESDTDGDGIEDGDDETNDATSFAKTFELDTQDDPDTPDVDESATVESRFAPGLRVQLSTEGLDFFQRNLLDKEGSSELLSSANFKNHFRGAMDTSDNASRIYLKGGAGSFAEIQLFEDEAEINLIKANNWVINEAHLDFLHRSGCLTEINSEDTALGVFLNYDGIIEKSGERGLKYTVNITEHINNIIIRDSINATLGLQVTSDIRVTGVNNVLLDNGDDKELPASAILSPLGTVLFGSAVSPAEEANKLKLEIFYTETN
ncbi:Glycogen synthase [Nymphon striatum]|nr:Glycogen synthase [Nymphon striatum]